MAYVSWEVTMECNYSCYYCTNLDKSIKPIPKEDIEPFIISIKERFPTEEVFVFGGEPFVHPHIEYIIQTFNKHKVDYVIQTNLSKKSVHVMNRITDPFKINISIHPTEAAMAQVVNCFERIPPNVSVSTVDVMYIGKKSIDYYMAIRKFVPEVTYLTPVGDFGDGVSDNLLVEYNEMRHNIAWNHTINFEQVEQLGRYRSVVWGDKDFSLKGKDCLLVDNYYYSASLECNDCIYRENNNGVCPHDKCF